MPKHTAKAIGQNYLAQNCDFTIVNLEAFRGKYISYEVGFKSFRSQLIPAITKLKQSDFEYNQVRSIQTFLKGETSSRQFRFVVVVFFSVYFYLDPDTTQIAKPFFANKTFKVQDCYESKMRRKIRQVPKFDAQMVMTRERGGDDRKLFPSFQSVNYGFPLIRCWSHLPLSPSDIPPPTIPFPNLRYSVNWFQEMSILRNRLWHCCWHSVLARKCKSE